MKRRVVGAILLLVGFELLAWGAAAIAVVSIDQLWSALGWGHLVVGTCALVAACFIGGIHLLSEVRS